MAQWRLNLLVTLALTVTSTAYFFSAQILTQPPIQALSKTSSKLKKSKQLWAGYHTFYYSMEQGGINSELLNKSLGNNGSDGQGNNFDKKAGGRLSNNLGGKPGATLGEVSVDNSSGNFSDESSGGLQDNFGGSLGATLGGASSGGLGSNSGDGFGGDLSSNSGEGFGGGLQDNLGGDSNGKSGATLGGGLGSNLGDGFGGGLNSNLSGGGGFLNIARLIEKALGEKGIEPIMLYEQSSPLLIKKESVEYALQNLVSDEYPQLRKNFFIDKTGLYQIFYVSDNFDTNAIKEALRAIPIKIFCDEDEDSPTLQYEKLPTIADYAFYAWNVKTYPYRAVGSDFVAVDTKIEVCYDEYGEGEPFEKNVVMSFDEQFVKKCLLDIAKLPSGNIEHLLQENVAGTPLGAGGKVVATK